MTLIIAHNRYRSGMPSGENIVACAETALLRRSGIPCRAWFLASDRLVGRPLAQLAALASLPPGGCDAFWRRRLLRCGADLLHAHNLLPRFGLSLLSAARSLGIPTAVTLHNHRLIAANTALFGPDGAHPPRDASERLHLSRLNAAHPSRLADFAYRTILGRAWATGLLPGLIDAWICLSPTQARHLLAAGVPRERIVVKPNGAPRKCEPGDGPGDRVVMVGRLDAGKGAAELLRAWDGLGLPLDIIGDGPARSDLQPPAGVRLLGALPPDETARRVAAARFLVTNPRCYETFGLVVAEAFAVGTPVLVPAGTSHADLVDDGVTGRVFAWGDDGDLRLQARTLWEEAPALRGAALSAWSERFTPERNLDALLRIHGNLRRGAAPSA